MPSVSRPLLNSKRSSEEGRLALLRCTLTALTLADAMDLMKAERVEIGQDSLRMLAS